MDRRIHLIRPTVRSTFASIGLLMFVFVSINLTGCAHHFPSERIPKTKWLVMALEQPPAMKTTPSDVRGWWFGARTLRQNPRAGKMFGQALNEKLASLDCINLYSAIDLKYYFARKRDRLKEAFPYLKDPELDTLMDQVSPLDYARELNADKVLSGRIFHDYMADNRTIHWWWSSVEVELTLTDVATGRIDWTRRYEQTGQLTSMQGVQNAIADKAVEDLKQEYLLPLASQ